jgi:hypothetical protein
MTVKIKLTRGKTAIVDYADYQKISGFKWRTVEAYKNTFYAATWMRTGGKGRHVYLHRFLLGFPEKEKRTNFINGNTLDCRRENLRLVTDSQSQMRRKLSENNSTGFRGVSFNKASGKYKAYIKRNGKLIHLGLFTKPKDAAKAYNEKAKELFGKFATLNHLDI